MNDIRRRSPRPWPPLPCCALPSADQIPRLEVGHLDCPSTVNPLGIKGVGRAGSSPGTAIANAVEDAPGDYGVEVDRIPVRSARILEMLRVARPG
jgi:aerobic carbon-monoxide dehydrogenase large subunit